MNLQTYLVEHCGGEVGELRRRIVELGECPVTFQLVWKWCRTDKPRVISGDYANAIERATKGLVKACELTSRAAVSKDFKPVRGPRQVLKKRTAKRKVAKKKARRSRRANA